MPTTFSPPDRLVTPAWLRERGGPGDDVLALDCWRPEAYERAHIPGAIHIGRDYWLKERDPSGGPRGIDLASAPDLADHFSHLGVDDDRHVITYDDNGGRAAARVWWILRYLGHERVSVLDGGWHAWLEANGGVSYVSPQLTPREFKVRVDRGRISDLSDVQAALVNGSAQLVDTRSREEWDGTDPHGNARAGRIPSAINLEWSSLVAAERPWTFKGEAEIANQAERAGLDIHRPIITYCQGGVRAAHVAFALELAGAPAVSVYERSMAEWANSAVTEMTAGEVHEVAAAL